MKHYARKVFYFGELKDRSEVAAEYEAYVRRWPYRRFAVPEDDISAACDASSRRCTVSMSIRWLAQSSERRQRSEGIARRSLILQESGDSFVVLSFEESIVSRNVTTAGAGAAQRHP